MPIASIHAACGDAKKLLGALSFIEGVRIDRHHAVFIKERMNNLPQPIVVAVAASLTSLTGT
jgi:hypothetical protein